MDKSERIKLKQLAVDAIAEYPVGHPIVPFAEALEKCIEWMDEVADRCIICSYCDNHGDHADDTIELVKP